MAVAILAVACSACSLYLLPWAAISQSLGCYSLFGLCISAIWQLGMLRCNWLCFLLLSAEFIAARALISDVQPKMMMQAAAVLFMFVCSDE